MQTEYPHAKKSTMLFTETMLEFLRLGVCLCSLEVCHPFICIRRGDLSLWILLSQLKPNKKNLFLQTLFQTFCSNSSRNFKPRKN